MKPRSTILRAFAVAAAIGVCATLVTPGLGGPELTGDAARAAEARDSVLELSLDQAADQLKGADPADQLLAIERARLALYRGDCELAVGILSRGELGEAKAAVQILAVARGCVRSAAGAVTFEDKERGVVIRFQDDEDTALGPFMADVAAKARELYKTDLGTELPWPIRVEVVRDQYGLSAMTGLPIEAARTTGTIAIAKWGRVIMVSPRASQRGYAFLDTLAHELSHLAQTRASKDRAPLWMQEGVARLEESRWRPPHPFDDVPSADDLSGFGIENHIGPDIDKIGPSIALLKSAMEAQVTYGKVMSFMRYWSAAAGQDALPKLLAEMGKAASPEDVEKAIERVSGTSFETWKERWEKDIAQRATPLPPELKPDAPSNKNLPEGRKRIRLGELFEARGQLDAAKNEFEKAAVALPREAVVRSHLASVLNDLGEVERARGLVASFADIYGNDPRWWLLRGILASGSSFASEADLAFEVALGLDPLDPEIACRSIKGKDTPLDPAQKALCETARRRPR